MAMIFTKGQRRRPIWLGGIPAEDPETRIPVWWCENCGAEIWQENTYGAKGRCDRCERERRIFNEKCADTKSVPGVYPGAGS